MTAYQARQVPAYEYDCWSCDKPLVDPEFEGPYLFRGLDDGTAPDLGDYFRKGDGCDTGVEVLDLPSGKTAYIHDGRDCWHWCKDGDEQSLGPADTCPDKATHEEGT